MVAIATSVGLLVGVDAGNDVAHGCVVDPREVDVPNVSGSQPRHWIGPLRDVLYDPAGWKTLSGMLRRYEVWAFAGTGGPGSHC